MNKAVSEPSDWLEGWGKEEQPMQVKREGD